MSVDQFTDTCRKWSMRRNNGRRTAHGSLAAVNLPASGIVLSRASVGLGRFAAIIAAGRAALDKTVMKPSQDMALLDHKQPGDTYTSIP